MQTDESSIAKNLGIEDKVCKKKKVCVDTVSCGDDDGTRDDDLATWRR